jgi:hypothetical protein
LHEAIFLEPLLPLLGNGLISEFDKSKNNLLTGIFKLEIALHAF